MLDVRPDDPDVALRAAVAAPDREDDRRTGLAANPFDDGVEVLADRRLAVHGEDDVAGLQPGFVGRTATEHADDERQAVCRRVDLDADADVRSGQGGVPRGSLLGRHERRVAGVADRLGHPVDRTVGELAVIERAGRDVVLVDRVPRLANQGELVTRRARRSRTARPSDATASRGEVDAADADTRHRTRR